MSVKQWISPLWWLRCFSEFKSVWFHSIPEGCTTKAIPALLGIIAISTIAILTYASDESWQRSLLLDQLRQARRTGSDGDVVILASRLLKDSPDDLDLRYLLATSMPEQDRDELAPAESDNDPNDLATTSQQSPDPAERRDALKANRAMLRNLALDGRHGASAWWLIEHDYMPIKWEEWDDAQRSSFGKLIEIAAKDFDNKPEILSLYSDYLIVTGTPDKALQSLIKLVPVQPGRALQGAMILRSQGKESQARELAEKGFEALNKLAIDRPEDVSLALARAQFAVFLSDYQESINLLTRTAKLTKDQRVPNAIAETFVLWSRDQEKISHSTERFATQLSLLSQATKIAPSHPLVVSDLMRVVLQCSDETDPKVAQLRDILVRGVAPELTHFIRGTSAMLKGDVNDAAIHLELAFKALPNAPAVLNNLAVALTSKSANEDNNPELLERALKLVDAAIEQAPNQPYFYETKAQILLKQKNYKDAVICFETALPAEALREQIHRGLSESYGALGQKDLADQHRTIAESLKSSSDSSSNVSETRVDFAPKSTAQKSDSPDTNRETKTPTHQDD